MTQFIDIHPTHPQKRLINQAVTLINQGGTLVYPTDSGYAIGCKVGEKNAIEKIRQLRKLDKYHFFTLLCHNLSQIAAYAEVDNVNFRLLKAYTPGSYTFILTATKEVPRRLLHPKRKTIGLRIPNHLVLLTLLAELNQPLMSISLILDEDEFPISSIEDFYQQLEGKVDLVINSGPLEVEPTSIVDLTARPPKVIREGKGDVSDFL